MARLRADGERDRRTARRGVRAALWLSAAWCALFLFFPHEDLGAYAGCGLA